MKNWELRIKADKLKSNTYTVVSNGFRFLCVKVKGEFYVKNKDNTHLANVSNIIKL